MNQPLRMSIGFRNVYIQSLCVGRHLTFAVYEFGIEINSTVPFNGVEGNPDALEMLILSYPSKHPKLEIRFHIKHTVFAIIERDSKRKVFIGNYL